MTTREVDVGNPESIFPSFEEDGTDILRAVGGLSRRDLYTLVAMHGLLKNPEIAVEMLPATAVGVAESVMNMVDEAQS